MARPLRRLGWRRAWLTGALLALAAGCEPSIPDGVFACARDADCPPGLACREVEERCYRDAPRADAGEE